jgi:hypothetical protein
MIQLILLHEDTHVSREQREDAPELFDHEGVSYSLRAGPRTPLPTDHVWDPVAVYAPDELSEEEFQALYEAARTLVPEFALRY